MRKIEFAGRGVALLAAAWSWMPAAAGAQVTVTSRQGALHVDNRVAVPFVVVLTAKDGAAGAVVGAVGAATTAEIRRPSGAEYQISRLEPVSWTIPITAAPRCAAAGPRADVRAEIARLRQHLATLSAAREQEAGEQAALATQIAQMEITMANEDRNQRRYNAFAMEVRRQYFRDNPNGQAYAEQDYNEDVEDFINSMAQLNKMFGAADDAKRSAIADEVRYLEPFALGADSALRQLGAEFARSRDQGRTGAGAMKLLARQLRDEAPTAPGVEIAGSARRTCAAPAGVEDWIEVEATPADPRTAVLIGEVQFDKGGRHDVVFRRLKGTERWIAALYWPPDAGSAKVKAQVDRRTVTVASELRPGRPTLAETRAAAESNIKSVKKRYQTLKFRAEGGDGLKTIIIP